MSELHRWDGSLPVVDAGCSSGSAPAACAAAHDLANLLMAIASHAGAVRAAADAAEREALAEQILRAAARGERLCRELLGRPGPCRQAPVDLALVVRDSLATLGAWIPARVKLEMHAGREEVVAGDAAELQRVVENLVRNAVEAIDGEGHVILAFEPGLGSQVRLVVEDDGRGMDAEVAERSFEPFFTTRDEGSGLGLASVAVIVANHGGTIRVESEPGRGSRFVAEFPRFPAALPAATEVGSRRGVLVVEDDAGVRRLVASAVHRLGLEAEAAGTLREGLERLAGAGAGLAALVVDLDLPDGSGLDLVAHASSPECRVPIVVVTGGEVPSGLPPAAIVLCKPFSPSDLSRLLARIVPVAAPEGSASRSTPGGAPGGPVP